MKELLRTWWEGTYVPAPENDPHSAVFIVSLGTYERHWTSKVAHWLLAFWLKEWKWTIGAAFTVLSVVMLRKF
jgi:hypothetical protein